MSFSKTLAAPILQSDNKADDDSTFFLLKGAPEEVLCHAFDFCDGKSLSTLSLAVSGCSIHEHLLKHVAAAGRSRLESIASRVVRFAGEVPEGRSLREASEWIRSILSSTPELFDERVGTRASEKAQLMMYLSENFAVLDFLESSIRDYSNEAEGHFEWPVWCGQICVDSFVTGSRLRNTARVLITSPFQRPTLIPGCSLMKNWTPSSLFRCEPYNMVPVPPWGQIRGLQAEDNRVLRPVEAHLGESGEVAVPSCFQAHEVLDVRITTKTQAKLAWPHIQHLRSSWLVQAETEPQLMCCWQDDSTELPSDRGYIEIILDILRTRARLAKNPKPSTREYLLSP